MNYIDTHAHLNLSAFTDDREEIATRCAEESVAVINIGTKASTSRVAVDLAEQYEHMFAIVGLHPIQATAQYHSEEEIGGPAFTSSGEQFDSDLYRTLATHAKVVGIGECGFDYWHNEKETYGTQERQFIEQIKLANELQLPLMIHTRNPQPGQKSPTGRSVYEDVYCVLKQYANVPFNVHFYAGTWEEATKFIDIGGTLSFTGVLTFPAHKPGIQEYLDVVEAVPLDRLFLETDCPYVAPVPYRGQRCEPWMVKEIYAKVAEVKHITVEQLQQQIRENVHHMYGISR